MGSVSQRECRDWLEEMLGDLLCQHNAGAMSQLRLADAIAPGKPNLLQFPAVSAERIALVSMEEILAAGRTM